MRCLVYFATFTLLACAEPPPIDGDITGYWYGQRWSGRARIIWLNHVDTDGRHIVQFKHCFNGDVLSRERQEGTARLRDGIYESVIERFSYTDVDGETTSSENEVEYNYRVLQLTDEVMSYADVESGESYDVVRVDESFTLECPPATQSISTNPGGRKGQDAWIVRGDAPDEATDDDEQNRAKNALDKDYDENLVKED